MDSKVNVNASVLISRCVLQIYNYELIYSLTQQLIHNINIYDYIMRNDFLQLIKVSRI